MHALYILLTDDLGAISLEFSGNCPSCLIVCEQNVERACEPKDQTLKKTRTRPSSEKQQGASGKSLVCPGERFGFIAPKQLLTHQSRQRNSLSTPHHWPPFRRPERWSWLLSRWRHGCGLCSCEEGCPSVPKSSYLQEIQEPRKGGFSKGGFCRVERHAQGNKTYPKILGSAVYLALRAPQPREAYIFAKAPF